ncbi:IS4/IS5 family transposase [Paraburkholderia sp. UYCP14C]|nr:IS4/IS5 family transposase [Paraburkholderia sp. UYCP14C]
MIGICAFRPYPKSRRSWRKLHLAVDASTGQVVAHTLTDQDADDPSQVAPLLDQIPGEIGRFIADGAYDGAPTYQTVAQHSAGVQIVIPPRSTAVRSCETGPPTQRDHHLDAIAAQGRLAWQKTSQVGMAGGPWSKRRWAATRRSSERA